MLPFRFELTTRQQFLLGDCKGQAKSERKSRAVDYTQESVDEDN